MNLAVSKGEKTLSDLAARLFDIKGPGSAEAAKKAGAALLAANPHLHDLTNLPPGTLIVIPDDPANPAVAAPQATDIGTEVEQQLEVAIKQFDDAISKSSASEKDTAANINETLANPDLRKFASQSLEIKAKLSSIAEATKKRLKEVEADAADQKQASTQLKDALEKLIRY